MIANIPKNLTLFTGKIDFEALDTFTMKIWDVSILNFTQNKISSVDCIFAHLTNASLLNTQCSYLIDCAKFVSLIRFFPDAFLMYLRKNIVKYKFIDQKVSIGTQYYWKTLFGSPEPIVTLVTSLTIMAATCHASSSLAYSAEKRQVRLHYTFPSYLGNECYRHLRTYLLLFIVIHQFFHRLRYTRFYFIDIIK